MDSYDDEKERPSWREIDKKKERSKHISQHDDHSYRPRSRKAKWAQKQYMKEIENLFKGKKATKEHAAALEEIHRCSGTKKFNTAVKKYIKEYDLPDDWSTLFLLLDYKDINVVKRVISSLKEMVAEEPLNIKEGFKSKLRIIAMTTTEDELRDTANETLEEL